jgi:predicted GNAT family N-acyltransferase
MSRAFPQGCTTRSISAQEVLPLRLEVLRPGRPPETAIFAGDDLPTTTHWGAFTPQGELVAIATLMEGSPKPDKSAEGGTGAAPGWQLRGMASSPSVRGQGYGAAVLQAVVDHVKARNGLLWCNARESAVGFYLGFGFKTEGKIFDIAGVGPHYVMKIERN